MSSRAVPRFLTDDDYAELNRAGRWYDRTLDRKPSDPSDSRRERACLAAVIEDHLQRAMRSEFGAKWFRCLAIGVTEGDGMSWSAERTAQLLAERHANFHLFTLSYGSASADSLPMIMQIIGERRFFKCVARSGISRDFRFFHGWVKPLISVLALAAVAWLKLGHVVVGDWLVKQSNVANVGFLLGLLLLFEAVTNGVHELAMHLTTRPTAAAVTGLRETLELSAQSSSQSWSAFVKHLARELMRTSYPRALVVDHFERVDLSTRAALLWYLDKNLGIVSGSELWVVFESSSGVRLSDAALERQGQLDAWRAEAFTQLPLAAEERQALAALVGHPDRAGLSTVKTICALGAAPDDRYVRIIDTYRHVNPPFAGMYSDIDLYFLLWLDSQAWHESVERHLIVQSFAVEKGLRAELLAELLPGTKHKIAEFDGALRRLEADLGASPLLTVEGTGVGRRLVFRGENRLAFSVLAEHPRLTPEGLGHAFWALFWYDKWRDRPLQAFAARKLAYHLVRSDLTPLHNLDLYARATLRLVDAFQFAIHAASRTCVYEPLPQMIERASTYVDAVPSQTERSRRKKLRDVCWEVYTLLGSDNSLSTFLLLLDPAEVAVEESFEPGERLAQLRFLDLIPVAPADRWTLGRALVTAARMPKGQDALPIYAGLRCAAFAFRQLDLPIAGDPVLMRDTLALAVTAADWARQLNGRLKAANTAAITETDLIATSFALSCMARLVRVRAGMPEEAAAVVEAPFDLLVELSETAILVASELAGTLEASAGSDLVRRALARKVCAEVLAALSSGTLRLGSVFRERPAAVDVGKIDEIVRFAGEQLKTELPRVKRVEDLLAGDFVRRVDELLEMSVFLFRRFDLEALAVVTESHRISFGSEFPAVAGDTWKRSEPLRTALERLKPRGSFEALYGYLCLAGAFRGSSELVADHVLVASGLVLDFPFGPGTQGDFALLAVLAAHHLDLDLARYLEFLTQEASGGGGYLLQAHLDALDDESLESVALCLLNAAETSSSPKAREKVHEVITRMSAGKRSETCKANLEALLKYFSFRERLKSQPKVDTPGTLQTWQAHRATWPYAAVLDVLVSKGVPDEMLTGEGLRTLSRVKPPGTNSVYINLALALSTQLFRRKCLPPLDRPPVAFLRAALPHWERRLQAQINVDAYRLLHMVTHGESAYSGKVIYWTAIKLQHDEAVRLIPLLKEHRFFSLFRYYFDFLWDWGLEISVDPDTLVRRLNNQPMERLHAVREWKAAGGRMPPALLGARNGPQVSADFLLLGSYLFDPALLDQREYEDDRRAFDDAARVAVTSLLNLTASLPALPKPIKDLVVAHSQRFDSISLSFAEEALPGSSGAKTTA
jgi:hypothetical protein